MNTTELKQVLFNKLQAEQTYFKKSDISIKKANEYKYIITIKDFEPFSFIMKLYFEDNEYQVIISRYYKNEYEGIISFTTSKKDYDIKYALIELGYHIATRF